MKSEAYLHGMRARLSELYNLGLRTNSPYGIDTDQYLDWLFGWYDAKNAAKSIDESLSKLNESGININIAIEYNGSKNDPKNYEAMAIPYETEEDLKAAFAAFDKDLSRIRKKHRIAELLVVKMTYFDDKTIVAMQTYGSELTVLPMANIALGNAVKINAGIINKLTQ